MINNYTKIIKRNNKMKLLFALLPLILFMTCDSGVVYAGDFTTSIKHRYENEEDKVVRDQRSLSINYNSSKWWVDESISHSKGVTGNENFMGGGFKYGWLSAGILWQHADNEDNYLASIRGECEPEDFKLVGYYQPYLNKDGYILKGNITFPLSDNISFTYGMESRSDPKMIVSSTGIEIKY